MITFLASQPSTWVRRRKRWNGASNVIMEQIFETLDGHIAARALVRGVFRRKGGTVPTGEIAEAAGWPSRSPDLPERVTAWLAAEDRLSERQIARAA